MEKYVRILPSNVNIKKGSDTSTQYVISDRLWDCRSAIFTIFGKILLSISARNINRIINTQYIIPPLYFQDSSNSKIEKVSDVQAQNFTLQDVNLRERQFWKLEYGDKYVSAGRQQYIDDIDWLNLPVEPLNLLFPSFV